MVKKDIKSLKREILEIIEWYGSIVDPQGWAIKERKDAVNKILKVYGHK